MSYSYFLVHGITMLVNHEKPHWSAIGLVLFALTSILLMAPYEWDRNQCASKAAFELIFLGLFC